MLGVEVYALVGVGRGALADTGDLAASSDSSDSSSSETGRLVTVRRFFVIYWSVSNSLLGLSSIDNLDNLPMNGRRRQDLGRSQ